MSRNEQGVARREVILTFSFQPEAGSTGQQQHPFVMGLFIRRVERRHLPLRDDPLDTYARPAEQAVKDFLRPRIW